MSWQGKVIGGSLGSFFGPWGALAGAAAGHWLVDRKKDGDSHKELLKLLAVCAAALQEVARASGPVSHDRDLSLRNSLQHLNRVLGNPAEATWLVAALDDAGRLGPGILLLANESRRYPQLAHEFLIALWRVAAAEGSIHPAALDCIRRFTAMATIAPDVAEGISALYLRPRGSSPAGARDSAVARSKAAELLGIPLSADPDRLRQAYHRESLKYHPDHVGADVPPAIRDLAAERFAAVKDAYDLLSGSGPGLSVARLFVLAPDADTLVPPVPGQIVRCFLCNAKVRLPAKLDGLADLRCPNCQALLAKG